MPAERPFLLGLTGSIGMGKSTTAQMLRDAGIPVWDADAAVHRAYAAGGAAVPAIGGLVPAAITDGQVDRAVLAAAIAADPSLLARIEAAVHPLLAADRASFLSANAGADILAYDIPLLFETGADAWLDAVLVVTAPPEVQRQRVLLREGMTQARFDALLSRQMPDAEKRARARFVIDTSTGMDAARAEVLHILDVLRQERAHA